MAQNTIITSSRIEAIQGWALPSRWSWSGTANGKSTSNLVSSLLLLAIQCMMWWQAWVPFFSGARFCWCFTHWTSPNLQHLLFVFPVGSGAWDPETSSRMVSPSVHQIRVEFSEEKPKGPHSGSIFRAPNKTTWLWGAMWEGGCNTPVAPRLCRHAWAGSQNGGLETRIWGAPWNLGLKNRVSTLKKPGQRTRKLTEVDFQNVPCAKIHGSKYACMFSIVLIFKYV